MGSNAVQLARCAGYRVIATASPHNFDYVRSLGAEAAFDYHHRTAVDQIIEALGDSPLAGTMAIGSGSLAPTLSIVSRTRGSHRIASAQPGPIERIQSRRQRRKGIQLSLIWGGTLKDNEVGPAIYVEFLPAALGAGAYRAARVPVIVGEGLEQIPVAIDRLRKGVSAKKLVIRL